MSDNYFKVDLYFQRLNKMIKKYKRKIMILFINYWMRYKLMLFISWIIVTSITNYPLKKQQIKYIHHNFNLLPSENE